MGPTGAIQSAVRPFTPSGGSGPDCQDYRPQGWDRRRQLSKLISLAGHLRRCGVVDESVIQRDLDVSLRNTDASFDLFEGRAYPPAAGSFAFVVPSRISRLSDEYWGEATAFLPILRHTDPSTRQWTVVGTCPWVIDRYRTAQDGSQGVMLMAPVFADMAYDVSGLSVRYRLIRDVVEATVRFAVERFGAHTVGLGAVLPRLTNYGKSVMVPGVRTTTGHAGTVWLAMETVRSVRQRWDAAGSARVGILGAGAIGLAMPAALLKEDAGTTVSLFDVDRRRLAIAASRLAASYGDGRVQVARSCRDLLAGGGLIISAVTGTVPDAPSGARWRHYRAVRAQSRDPAGRVSTVTDADHHLQLRPGRQPGGQSRPGRQVRHRLPLQQLRLRRRRPAERRHRSESHGHDRRRLTAGVDHGWDWGKDLRPDEEVATDDCQTVRRRGAAR